MFEERENARIWKLVVDYREFLISDLFIVVLLCCEKGEREHALKDITRPKKQNEKYKVRNRGRSSDTFVF